MKINEIPFNMQVYFDEQLRDIPEDTNEMQQGIRYLQDCVHRDDSSVLHGLIGVFCRIVGRLDEAERHLTKAISLYQKEGNISSVLANKIRLAHVYQWKNEFAKADSLYEEILEQIVTKQQGRHLLDFTYQHYGKSKFDQQEYRGAYELFEKALRIRVKKNSEELVQSTEHAMRITKRFFPEEV
ncbi:tetratricopeptide repeat protein [Caldalkalibacillus mannanilyticus]|uniref:tetratricopeptide repeat protein n=1 Tax=Caldalkalibacillus mannanilyticus TaxID=1418 RepID=UPI000467EE30|nr:hypothetical protein [Caldalkalibacillus mannanilyticus]